MGCRQSSIEEQVQAPASTAPVSEVAAPAPVEVAPVSSAPATEEVAAEAEAPAAVEEAPASSAVSEPVSTEAIASETQQEVVEVTEVAAPAAEPVAEEPAAVEAAEAPVEPEAETAPVEEEAPKEPTVTFVSAGVAVEGSVVYYQFTVVDKEDPAKELAIRKRFNDFKALYAQVTKTYPTLPPLPKAGVSSVLLGRKNKNLTADREAQFTKILNAIAANPGAIESDAVKAFLV